MAKAKSTTKAKKSASKTSRRLRIGNYKSFRLQLRIKHPKSKIKGAPKLFKASLQLLINNWKLFGGIVLIYIVLDIILVKGLSSGTNIPSLKQNLQGLFGGSKGQIATGFTLFGLLLGSAGQATSDLASAYQSMLLVIVSLAIIWSLRQVLAKEKIGVKDAFYKGLYPLVPFLLVILVIGLQFIPLLLANFLYSIVIGQGLAVTITEKVLWVILLFLLALLSIYMVCSSVFALYIVTLPDMRPMQALRSAREVVRYRRWTIIRRVLFLPFIMLVIAAVITIPIILFLTPVAEWVFFLLTMLALPVAHAYMYSLYRELL